MRYEIEMIDVKAADAFLIHYVEENGESHIIMVDSGNYEDAYFYFRTLDSEISHSGFAHLKQFHYLCTLLRSTRPCGGRNRDTKS